MRVTNQMLHDTVLRNIQNANNKLLRLQNQISSGKRLNLPSDDPASAGRVLALRSSQIDNEQYLKNVDLALAWMNTTDAALANMVDVIHRVRELIIAAANQIMRPDDILAVRQEVQQLLEHSVQVANARFGEQHLFAGHNTLTTPFELVPGPGGTQMVEYRGDDGVLERSIGPGIRLSVGISGNRGFTEYFAALTDLLTDLANQDTTALRGKLDALAAALATFTDLRVEVGAKTNRLEAFAQRFTAERIELISLRSKVEDVDLAAAITEMNAEQNVYQAALATGARVIQPSLFDFLR